MTSSITNGFIKQAQDKIKAQNLGLEKQTDEVRKSVMEFNKRFNASIKSTKSILESISDKKTKKELEEAIKSAEDYSKVQKKLIKQGTTISSNEAEGLITAAENLNKIVTTNDEVVSKIKQQGQNIEDLDIETPLKAATKRIGENAKDFFVENAENISRSGLVDNVSSFGLSAISPELAFATEAMGLNLTGALSNLGTLFKGSSDFVSPKQGSGDDIDALLDGVESRINSDIATPIVTSVIEDSNSTILSDGLATREEIKNSIDDSDEERIKSSRLGAFLFGRFLRKQSKLQTSELVDELETQIVSTESDIDRLISNDNMNHEMMMELFKDQHVEVIEELDDLSDAKSGGMLDRFFGKNSKFNNIMVAIGASISGILTKFGGGKLGKAGAVGMGAFFGAKNLQNIQQEGLTTGGLISSVGSGALVGSAFGPLGALIGAGVGGLAAVIADNISDEQLAIIKSAFSSLSTFFTESVAPVISNIGSFIGGTLFPTLGKVGGFLKDAFGPAINEFFKLGESVFNAMSLSAEGLVRIIPPVIDAMVSAGKFVNENVVPPVSSFLKEFVLGSILTFGKVLEITIGGVRAVFDTVVDSIIKVGEFLGTGAAIAVETTTKVIGWVSSTYETVSNFISDGITTISDFFTSVGESISSLIDKIMVPIKSVKQKADQALDFIGIGSDSNSPSLLGFAKDRAGALSEITSSLFGFGVDNELPTEGQIGSNMAQIEAANMGSYNNTKQLEAQMKQHKSLIKLLQEQKEKQQSNSKYQGRRSLDNSPVVSNDIGLIMTLGGGL
ncbi:MAG: hypothetical protein HKO92_11420 [Flavobacteriaceae bacterium]|nr:hypothetical protein [Flavobacteriaceae bacterium]